MDVYRVSNVWRDTDGGGGIGPLLPRPKSFPRGVCLGGSISLRGGIGREGVGPSAASQLGATAVLRCEPRTGRARRWGAGKQSCPIHFRGKFRQGAKCQSLDENCTRRNIFMKAEKEPFLHRYTSGKRRSKSETFALPIFTPSSSSSRPRHPPLRLFSQVQRTGWVYRAPLRGGGGG